MGGSMNPKTSLVIKIIVFVFGLVLLVTGFNFLRSNSSNWPTVQGQVTSSVKRFQPSNSLDNPGYDVTYTYQVNNTKYETTDKMDDQPVNGAAIKVYYDPSDPHTHVLSPAEDTFSVIIGMIFGLICIGGIGWGWIKALVVKKNKTSPVV